MKNNSIKIGNQEFPTRTFNVIIDGDERQITIGTSSLNEALDWQNDPLHEQIDQTIYFYVEDEDIFLPAKEICESCLDEPVEFVSEEGEFMVAKLVDVSLRTRVVVNANSTDEEIVQIAKPKFLDKIHNELMENLEEIYNDDEIPCGEILDDFDSKIRVDSNKVKYDHINSLDLRSFIEAQLHDEEMGDQIFKVEFCGQLEPGVDSWAIDLYTLEDDLIDSCLYSSEYEYEQDVKILKGEV